MVVGIDPSNTFTGLGALLYQPGEGVPRIAPVLRNWTVLSMPGFEGVNEGVDQVVAAFERMRDSYLEAIDGQDLVPVPLRAIRVRIEEPPEAVRADVNHGHQAVIGWKLGYLVGAIARAIHHPRVQVELVPVYTWRTKMLQLSTLWGVPAVAPGESRGLVPRPPPSQLEKVPGRPMRQKFSVDRPAGGGLEVVWSGCDHREPVASLEVLQTSPPTFCASCAQVPKLDPVRPLTAEERREAWKELACALVKAHWPTWYDATVREVRDRARDKSKPDHQLAGIADACEAVWIAASFVGEAP